MVVVVFIGNPFEMKLLNLRINFFYLLRTFFLHLSSYFIILFIYFFLFLLHYVSAKFPLWPSSGYKTQHSYPRSRLITRRRPEVKFGRNVVKKKQQQKRKNYQDEDKKSTINKKINSMVVDFSISVYHDREQMSNYCRFSLLSYL